MEPSLGEHHRAKPGSPADAGRRARLIPIMDVRVREAFSPRSVWMEPPLTDRAHVTSPDRTTWPTRHSRAPPEKRLPSDQRQPARCIKPTCDRGGRNGNSRTVRWVLGFDGGCATCRSLAQEIGRLCGDKLSVRNLREPELLRWRMQALGAVLPGRQPSLEVSGGDKVRAWTGLGLAAQLPRVAGSKTAIRILNLVGEISSTQQHTSRRRFLHTVGATALSLSILSGRQALAPPRAAAGGVGNRPTLQVESTRDLAGTERDQYLDKILARKEIGEALRASNTGLKMSDFSLYGCAAHPLTDNNVLTATTWTAQGEYVLIHYYFKHPIPGMKQVEAALYQAESDQSTRLLGRSGRESRPRAQQTAPTAAQLLDCDCIYGDNPGHTWYWLCDSMNWGCVTINCAWCAASCVANIALCIACFGLYCPAQLVVSCSTWHWECNQC
jgi:hypothetical protein